jgi:hypothetical protein
MDLDDALKSGVPPRYLNELISLRMRIEEKLKEFLLWEKVISDLRTSHKPKGTVRMQAGLFNGTGIIDVFLDVNHKDKDLDILTINIDNLTCSDITFDIIFCVRETDGGDVFEEKYSTDCKLKYVNLYHAAKWDLPLEHLTSLRKKIEENNKSEKRDVTETTPFGQTFARTVKRRSILGEESGSSSSDDD